MDRVLRDLLSVEGSRAVRGGDATAIDHLLATQLVEVAYADDGWRILLKHRLTQEFWELSYPDSEMQGAGARQLRTLALSTFEEWR